MYIYICIELYKITFCSLLFVCLLCNNPNNPNNPNIPNNTNIQVHSHVQDPGLEAAGSAKTSISTNNPLFSSYFHPIATHGNISNYGNNETPTVIKEVNHHTQSQVKLDLSLTTPNPHPDDPLAIKAAGNNDKNVFKLDVPRVRDLAGDFHVQQQKIFERGGAGSQIKPLNPMDIVNTEKKVDREGKGRERENVVYFTLRHRKFDELYLGPGDSG